jgi:hypothetical protein
MSDSKRTLHFTTPGLRPVLLEIVPEVNGEKSKRYPLIETEDNNLNINFSSLEESTKLRNRTFQDRLDAVWSLTTGWEAKLRAEAKEASDTITDLREEYTLHFEKNTADLLKEINDSFDKLDNLYEKEDTHLVKIDEDREAFVKVTVPDSIETTTGAISRSLKKAYETYDIEKQKESKREKKFCIKASSHIQSTEQRFVDEDALIQACFYTLSEEVIETERRSSRMLLHQWDKSVTSTSDVALKQKEGSMMREREDVDLLDTVLDTQALLQKMVLEHFGSDGGGDEEEENNDQEFTKLNNRMEKITSKQ